MRLVYGDAQQFLGVAYTVPFEAAALEACGPASRGSSRSAS